MTRSSFDQRLRADAARLRQAPSPDLHERILARLADAEPRVSVARGERSRWKPVLAAAAAVLVVASLWSVAGRDSGSPDAGDAAQPALSGDVVALSRSLLDPPLLASVTRVEDPLLAEARNLWADTSRAAESVARGLRTPLRLRTN